jgi:hypothetical protein
MSARYGSLVLANQSSRARFKNCEVKSERFVHEKFESERLLYENLGTRNPRTEGKETCFDLKK